MKKILIVVFAALVSLLFFPEYSFSNTKPIPLQKAMKSKLVDIRSVSNGGYCNKGLSLTLTNNKSTPVTVRTESGLIFRPDDKRCQPLILLGGDVIVLNANEVRSVNLQTFCGNSGARAPYHGIRYTYAGRVDTNLVAVLQFAKQQKIEPNIIQRAVWMFTNHHSLSTVYSYLAPKQSARLVMYIAKKIKMDLPVFFVEQQLDTIGIGGIIKEGEEHYYVNMSWNNSNVYRNVYVSVYREDGSVYKEVEDGIVFDKKGGSVVVGFYAKRDKAGLYTVRVHDDANKTLQEKVVRVGPERM